MNAEIISIGDELTSGQRLDTNSQWLSQQLGDLGIRVLYHSTVADDLAANVAIFRKALERADIVLSTGGLGPTDDDLTRDSLAKVLDVELYRDEASLAHIKNLFAKRNRPMPEKNVVQADFPETTVPIFNPHGSAPGILWLGEFQGSKKLLMTFPGVPAELKEMFAQTGAPELAKFLGTKRKFLVHKPIRCFGLGESDIEARLPEIVKRGRDPQVGITASSATITLRISATGSSESECEKKISETELIIRECLGELVFGTDDDDLQHVVIKLLKARKETLSLVEVGTGGYVSHLLSEVEEAGETFIGSYVTRNNNRITQFLGAGCDIPETARKLAERARNVFESDYAIAIDAFPDNDSDLLRIALATPNQTLCVDRPFGGHPSILLPRATKQALNELRLWLLKHP